MAKAKAQATELTSEEKLKMRNIQVDVLLAQNKINEFISVVNGEIQRLRDDLAAKDSVLLTHIQGLAKSRGLDAETTVFDWNQMAFTPKPTPPTQT